MEKAERALDQNLVTSNKERTVATESSSGHHLSWEQFKDSNPLFFSIPTKALKYYFTANKKCKRSRSTAGEQSIAVDAEDWKKLLPLAPLLAYFLPRKRTQKKSDKAMAGAPRTIADLLFRTKTSVWKTRNSAPKKKTNLRSTRTRTKPHYLKPLPATKPHSMNQQTIQPHLPTNVLSGSGSTKKTRSVKNSTRLTRERKNSSSRRLRAG